MENNTNENTSSSEYIDLLEVGRNILKHKKVFFIVWGITFVVACALIIPVPRTYESTVRIAPETKSTTNLGAMAALANTFGMNIGSLDTKDALAPELYPDIITTHEFIVNNLFNVPIRTIDGKTETTYLDYMRMHQKITYYKWPKIIVIYWSDRIISSTPPQTGVQNGTGAHTINPSNLGKGLELVVQRIREKISCYLDKKTNVLSITVADQDPLVACQIADTICVRLQQTITDYRTQKARSDAKYYQQLLDETKLEYEQMQQEYNQLYEKSSNTTSSIMSGKKDDLINRMNILSNTYSAFWSQYQMANARIQEQTPAFTILERPTVPIKASEPKRMVFVITMLIISTIITAIYLFRKELLFLLSGKKQIEG